jgi:predicted amidohydrolase
VQLKPVLGNKLATIIQAEKLISSVTEPVDIIHLGEMALLRYKYEDSEDVAQWSEFVPDSVDAIPEIKDATSTFKWAYRISKQFSAWVQCGFVEKHTDGRFYNSLMMLHTDLKELHIVRKVYLYEADKAWSQPESCISGKENNFTCFDLKLPRIGRSIKVGLGVCMDINWKDFREGHSHEKFLADF